MRAMRWLELHAWWGLLATAVLMSVFGLTDVMSGAAADPAIPLGLTGMTLEELQAEGPTAYRLFDLYTRVNGISLTLIGLLFAAVLLFAFRQDRRWAWWTMWMLPIWERGPVFYLVVGVQPDEPPPPPMISGPILAVFCASILLVSAPVSSGAQSDSCRARARFATERLEMRSSAVMVQTTS